MVDLSCVYPLLATPVGNSQATGSSGDTREGEPVCMRTRARGARALDGLDSHDTLGNRARVTKRVRATVKAYTVSNYEVVTWV